MPRGFDFRSGRLVVFWPLSAPAADKLRNHSFFPCHVSIDALDGAGSRAVQKIQHRQ